MSAKKILARLAGWAVDWDDSLPLRDLFFWDADTRHCTYWLWRQRLNEWFVCPRKGHDWYPDMCGRPEHDICERCQTRRDEVAS